VLPAIVPERVDRKSILPDQCQGSRGGSLVDADRLRELRGGQLGDRFQNLQCRVLGSVHAALGEDFLC
jgi:hypothetical protein